MTSTIPPGCLPGTDVGFTPESAYRYDRAMREAHDARATARTEAFQRLRAAIMQPSSGETPAAAAKTTVTGPRPAAKLVLTLGPSEPEPHFLPDGREMLLSMSSPTDVAARLNAMALLIESARAAGGELQVVLRGFGADAKTPPVRLNGCDEMSAVALKGAVILDME